MSTIELIPLDKGNRLVLDSTTATIITIGRTPNIGCLDKKISRNHAELHMKSDGCLWIKPIHHNPTFYRAPTQQLTALTKDEEFQLHDGDEIGLLPNEYFYQISIKSNDNQEKLAETSAAPKSPVRDEAVEDSSSMQQVESSSSPPPAPQEASAVEEEHSTMNDRTLDQTTSKDPTDEPEGGIILHTSRSLPAWMSTSPASEPKGAKGRGKSKKVVTPTKPTPSPSKYRTYIGRKKVESIEYGEDEDSDEESAQTKTTSSNQNSVAPSTSAGPVKRERCPYGKFCYRKNPLHRQEAIHPGDPEWDNKENDVDEEKPECPYGSECYRKNPDHFNEYSHTQKRVSTTKTPQRASKRKGSDAEEDNDGLPNEYDYDDSFIDDEDADDSSYDDREKSPQKRSKNGWKPKKKIGHSGDDDAEDDQDDDDEINLLKREAAKFVDGSSIHDQRPAKKRARLSMPDEYD